MVQMFPNNDAVFQDDSLPIHTAKVFSLGLRSMKMHFRLKYHRTTLISFGE